MTQKKGIFDVIRWLETRVIDPVRRVVCGRRGHEMVFHYEKNRLALRCIRCGHQTTGWILRQRTEEPPAGLSFAQRSGRSGHATP